MGLARQFGSPRPGADLGALWASVVAIAREPEWYGSCGVADTMPGRFDAVCLVTALVLLRMEGEPALRGPSARLTERFVADMDGQLRQQGVGDLVVGKRIGKLMGALGGRLDAYRAALATGDPAGLVEAVRRNVTQIDGADPALLAARIGALRARLAATGDAALLAGEIAA